MHNKMKETYQSEKEESSFVTTFLSKTDALDIGDIQDILEANLIWYKEYGFGTIRNPTAFRILQQCIWNFKNHELIRKNLQKLQQEYKSTDLDLIREFYYTINLYCHCLVFVSKLKMSDYEKMLIESLNRRIFFDECVVGWEN